MTRMDRFWAVACEYQRLMRTLLALLAVMAALLVFSFAFLEPGSGSYVIALVDLGLLAIAFVVIGGITLGCARREKY